MSNQFDKYSKEELNKQIEREDIMFSLGLEKFKEKLQAQKLGNDYSRSAAGKFIEKNMLDALGNAVHESFSQARAGINGYDCHRVYKSLTGIPEFSKENNKTTGKTYDLWDPHVVALITLRMLLDSCHMPLRDLGNFDKDGRKDIRNLAVEIGSHIEGEFLIRKGRHYFPDSDFRPGFVSRVCKSAASANAGRGRALSARRKKLLKIQRRWEETGSPLANTLAWDPWSRELKEKVARKVMSIIVTNLETHLGQQLFTDKIKQGTREYFGFTEFGEKWADMIDGHQLEHSFVPLPMLVKPKDHTKEAQGGYLDMNKPTVRRHSSRTFSGFLEPSETLVAFANTAQQVPYRINPFIADLVEEIYSNQERRLQIGSFGVMPSIDDYDVKMPVHLADLPRDNPERMKVVNRMEEQNDKFIADKKDWMSRIPRFMQVMRLSRPDERFYIPTYLDWRGRTYYRHVGLSPQGCDHEKAILEWADPVAVDDQTEFWLMMQITSCMGYDKVSFQDRVAKVIEVQEQLIASVRDPLYQQWWQDQDKPWGLLAAAAEWVRLFVDNHHDRTTRARVNFDASCSGQQILSGLLLDYNSGSKVNIVDADEPQDVYGFVVRDAQRRLEEDSYHVPVDDTSVIPRAKLQLTRGHGKSLFMVSQYGAGSAKRIKELMTYTKEPKVIDKLKAEPLTADEARKLYFGYFAPAMKSESPALDDYIKFARKVTQLTLQSGKKEVILPSADGSIVHQTYVVLEEDGVVKTTQLGNVKMMTKHINMVPGEETSVENQTKGTPPNLIHAQDRSTLSLALSDFQQPFATVHDSIYGRPSREMSEIKQRLLQAYYDVFTSGVLEEFVAANGLEPDEVPIPYKNTYDPALILQAKYAFS